jgi:transcriptional regulator with XRE-family HTH domain
MCYQAVDAPPDIVAGMVTRIHKHQRPRLFLKEHREAKGISATTMAGRLGIERESVYRLERKPWTLTAQKQADYAHALDLEVEDLWRPPGRPSLDAMVKTEPDELQAMAADIVRRLVARRS